MARRWVQPTPSVREGIVAQSTIRFAAGAGVVAASLLIVGPYPAQAVADKHGSGSHSRNDELENRSNRPSSGQKRSVPDSVNRVLDLGDADRDSKSPVDPPQMNLGTGRSDLEDLATVDSIAPDGPVTLRSAAVAEEPTSGPATLRSRRWRRNPRAPRHLAVGGGGGGTHERPRHLAVGGGGGGTHERQRIRCRAQVWVGSHRGADGVRPVATRGGRKRPFARAAGWRSRARAREPGHPRDRASRGARRDRGHHPAPAATPAAGRAHPTASVGGGRVGHREDRYDDRPAVRARPG